MVENTTPMGTMLEMLKAETEMLDNIYSEENVVAQEPQVITVPKHELMSRLADEH